MGNAFKALMLVLFLGLCVVGAAFVVQNSARTTQLSLNLGVAAWELRQPVSVMGLIGLTFGLGTLLGALPMFLRARTLKSRVRTLEREVAMNDSGGF